jgi:hypothetical protein
MILSVHDRATTGFLLVMMRTRSAAAWEAATGLRYRPKLVRAWITQVECGDQEAIAVAIRCFASSTGKALR